MQILNFPAYPLKIIKKKNGLEVFDRIRKKYISLTPEEWVRQHLVWYLIEELKYPEGLIKLEYSFTVNEQSVRSDIVVFSRNGVPLLLVECKAPSINIGNNTFQQAGLYNLFTKAKNILITNGKQHINCCIDSNSSEMTFTNEIPAYKTLLK